MNIRDSVNHVSPSLLGGRLSEAEMLESGAAAPPTAFELKFHVPLSVAAEVERWAAGGGGGAEFSVDPHGDPSRGGVYDTTTLYLDTPELDVYHRREGYAKRKYRVRRYGADSAAHLECKTKRGDRVRKERSVVTMDDLPLLVETPSPRAWNGCRFHSEIAERRLGPACVVAYTRLAFIGSCPEGPLRLTIDRDARSVLRDDWSLELIGPREGAAVLTGYAIVEMKYLTALPLPFKELLAKLATNPGGVSKYRLSRAALGAAPAGGAGAGTCPTG